MPTTNEFLPSCNPAPQWAYLAPVGDIAAPGQRDNRVAVGPIEGLPLDALHRAWPPPPTPQRHESSCRTRPATSTTTTACEDPLIIHEHCGRRTRYARGAVLRQQQSP